MLGYHFSIVDHYYPVRIRPQHHRASGPGGVHAVTVVVIAYKSCARYPNRSLLRAVKSTSDQDEAWLWQIIEAGLKQRFRGHPGVREALARCSDDVRAGRMAASVAARRLLDLAH